MELNQFSASLVTTPEEAKNLLTLLIGFNFTGQKEKVTDAIIAVYESFPDEYKKQDKIFGPAFNKLFQRYPIESQHVPYFLKFHKLWPTSDEQTIRKKNPSLAKELGTKVFKNSLEFAKSFSVYGRNGSPEDAFSFLDENKETIKNLVKKDKAKFVDNIGKQQSWEKIIISDYSRFKEFCNEFEFNHLNILKKELFNNYSSLNFIIRKIQDETLFSIFNDVGHDEGFHVDTNFFSMPDKREDRYQINVLHAAILCLYCDLPKSFSYLYKTYTKELSACMQYYTNKFELYRTNKDATNEKDWLTTFDSLLEAVKGYGNHEPFNDYEIKHIVDKIKKNPAIISANVLESELPNKNASSVRRMKV